MCEYCNLFVIVGSISCGSGAATASPPAAEPKRYDVIIASAGVQEDLSLAQLINGGSYNIAEFIAVARASCSLPFTPLRNGLKLVFAPASGLVILLKGIYSSCHVVVPHQTRTQGGFGVGVGVGGGRGVRLFESTKMIFLTFLG